VTAAYSRASGSASSDWHGRIPAERAFSSVQDRRQPRARTAEKQQFLAVAGESGLHEEFHIALDIHAGHVESEGAALRAIAQQVLHETEARVTGVA